MHEVRTRMCARVWVCDDLWRSISKNVSFHTSCINTETAKVHTLAYFGRYLFILTTIYCCVLSSVTSLILYALCKQTETCYIMCEYMCVVFAHMYTLRHTRKTLKGSGRREKVLTKGAKRQWDSYWLECASKAGER